MNLRKVIKTFERSFCKKSFLGEFLDVIFQVTWSPNFNECKGSYLSPRWFGRTRQFGEEIVPGISSFAWILQEFSGSYTTDAEMRMMV